MEEYQLNPDLAIKLLIQSGLLQKKTNSNASSTTNVSNQTQSAAENNIIFHSSNCDNSDTNQISNGKSLNPKIFLIEDEKVT